MNLTKFSGIITGLFFVGLSATNFFQLQFGTYAETTTIPTGDIAVAKWICIILTLLFLAAFIKIARAPVPGRRR